MKPPLVKRTMFLEEKALEEVANWAAAALMAGTIETVPELQQAPSVVPGVLQQTMPPFTAFCTAS